VLDWHQQTVLDYYIFYIHAVITQLAIRLTDYVNSGISKSKLKSFFVSWCLHREHCMNSGMCHRSYCRGRTTSHFCYCYV